MGHHQMLVLLVISPAPPQEDDQTWEVLLLCPPELGGYLDVPVLLCLQLRADAVHTPW
jgi:hypothetical protein